MSLEIVGLLLGGLIALLVGAEGLVRGASGLALRAGISPLIIGLTVVAIGTSSPEIAVSVDAAVKGQADIALGNVIGSNIFNVLVVLGLSALITPLIVQQQLIRLDVPLLVVVSLGVWLLALDGVLAVLEGLLLVSLAAAYIIFLIRMSRRESSTTVQAEYRGEYGAGKPRVLPWPVHALLVAVGLALLILGAGWLVDGAVQIARAFGVSELVIGLTVIAAGTSLPEVATSILAAMRGERDIAVGNVIGSNLFNIMGVLGIAALVSPNGIPVRESVQHFDLAIMFAVALVCLPVLFTGHVIARWEGALFVAYYIFYTFWLLLDTTDHSFADPYGSAMLYFVVPLTFITLSVIGYRQWKAHGQSA